jgi:hypothetical protein
MIPRCLQFIQRQLSRNITIMTNTVLQLKQSRW